MINVAGIEGPKNQSSQTVEWSTLTGGVGETSDRDHDLRTSDISPRAVVTFPHAGRSGGRTRSDHERGHRTCRHIPARPSEQPCLRRGLGGSHAAAVEQCLAQPRILPAAPGRGRGRVPGVLLRSHDRRAPRTVLQPRRLVRAGGVQGCTDSASFAACLGSVATTSPTFRRAETSSPSTSGCGSSRWTQPPRRFLTCPGRSRLEASGFPRHPTMLQAPSPAKTARSTRTTPTPRPPATR